MVGCYLMVSGSLITIQREAIPRLLTEICLLPIRGYMDFRVFHIPTLEISILCPNHLLNYM
jgi:hypothetical protein